MLALLNCLFLLLGMFLHSAAAIILVVPVVMPLVKAVGIDPVHFGLIVTINLGIGQQTPPVASVLMVASSIAKESIWDVTRVNVWFIAVLVAVLLLVTYVPVVGLGPGRSSSTGRSTMTELIQVTRDGAIATVVLNRPDKLNALTRPMWSALGDAIDALSADDDLALRHRARRRREGVLSGQRHRRSSPPSAPNKAQAIEYGRDDARDRARARASAGIRWSRRSTASASAAASRSRRCATCASAANRAASARRSRASAW